jgi:hypothetical protein
MRLSLLLLGLNLAALPPLYVVSKNKTATIVYICKGKNSERYHFDRNCRGLKNCSTKIYPISIEEARSMGRTLCGWEQ